MMKFLDKPKASTYWKRSIVPIGEDYYLKKINVQALGAPDKRDQRKFRQCGRLYLKAL